MLLLSFHFSYWQKVRLRGGVKSREHVWTAVKYDRTSIHASFDVTGMVIEVVLTYDSFSLYFIAYSSFLFPSKHTDEYERGLWVFLCFKEKHWCLNSLISLEKDKPSQSYTLTLFLSSFKAMCFYLYHTHSHSSISTDPSQTKNLYLNSK